MKITDCFEKNIANFFPPEYKQLIVFQKQLVILILQHLNSFYHFQNSFFTLEPCKQIIDRQTQIQIWSKPTQHYPVLRNQKLIFIILPKFKNFFIKSLKSKASLLSPIAPTTSSSTSMISSCTSIFLYKKTNLPLK